MDLIKLQPLIELLSSGGPWILGVAMVVFVLWWVFTKDKVAQAFLYKAYEDQKLQQKEAEKAWHEIVSSVNKSQDSVAETMRGLQKQTELAVRSHEKAMKAVLESIKQHDSAVGQREALTIDLLERIVVEAKGGGPSPT